MIDKSKIKGLIFDYGGTIDSNGLHWSEVIWKGYESECVVLDKDKFRDAYVFAERKLGKNPIIKPFHNFQDMLRIKMGIQFEWLKEQDLLSKETDDNLSVRIADWCYNYAKRTISQARPLLLRFSQKYPMVLVSNFYGNIETVLKDFQLDTIFPKIIESAVVGIRKPDPRIFSLGVDALGLKAEETVVIGDSFDKDIIPAASLGCQTIWLKNIGWSAYKGNESADEIISDFLELDSLI